MSKQAARTAPSFFWTQQAVAGKNMSGVTVATIDYVDLLRLDACLAHRRLRRFGSHVTRCFVCGRNPALTDAGPGPDPFVGRIDGSVQVPDWSEYVREHNCPSR